MSQLQTRKSDITQTRLVGTGNQPDDFSLQAGDILVQIERFAFTANNVTYGAIGEQIGYWQFFPPVLSPTDDEDWGLVPVWGYGRVVRSQNEEIEEGERLYGYFPMARYLQMSAGKISPARLIDCATHREALPPVYNNYDRHGKAEPNKLQESLLALLGPLFSTAFCLCDALEEGKYHDAEQVLIVSASSKTAIGLAYGLARKPRGDRPSIIGLTSSGNVDFVTSLGLYDSVISYDALDAPDKSPLDTITPAVLVDMSGNRAVLGAMHEMLGDNMRWCHNVGLTHWDDTDTKADPHANKINRNRSAMFFAPGHIQKRVAEWGADGWAKRSQAFVKGGVEHASNWIDVKETNGLAAFQAVYAKTVAGHMTPKEGLIILP